MADRHTNTHTHLHQVHHMCMNDNLVESEKYEKASDGRIPLKTILPRYYVAASKES